MTYEKSIQPMIGMKDWPDEPNKQIRPPKYEKKRPGRPKKARNKNPNEPTKPNKGKIKKPNKMSKVGTVVHCSHCKQSGHNIRGCHLISKEVFSDLHLYISFHKACNNPKFFLICIFGSKLFFDRGKLKWVKVVLPLEELSNKAKLLSQLGNELSQLGNLGQELERKIKPLPQLMLR